MEGNRKGKTGQGRGRERKNMRTGLGSGRKKSKEVLSGYRFEVLAATHPTAGPLQCRHLKF